MPVYQSKSNLIPGTTFELVEKIALRIFKEIKSKSKRTPYIRASFFNKEKVFLNIFWSHLHNKKDRLKRLKCFDAAIDLIKNSKVQPDVFIPLKPKNIKLYRFKGKTKQGEIFFVQIKENTKTKRKDLISIFLEN